MLCVPFPVDFSATENLVPIQFVGNLLFCIYYVYIVYFQYVFLKPDFRVVSISNI